MIKNRTRKIWKNFINEKTIQAANFICSIYLLINWDTLLLRPSLHFTQKTFTTLHPIFVSTTFVRITYSTCVIFVSASLLLILLSFMWTPCFHTQVNKTTPLLSTDSCIRCPHLCTSFRSLYAKFATEMKPLDHKYT
jgi:hypothetical protein